MTKFYSVFGTNYQQYLWLQLPSCSRKGPVLLSNAKTASLHIEHYVTNQLSDTSWRSSAMFSQTWRTLKKDTVVSWARGRPLCGCALLADPGKCPITEIIFQQNTFWSAHIPENESQNKILTNSQVTSRPKATSRILQFHHLFRLILLILALMVVQCYCLCYQTQVTTLIFFRWQPFWTFSVGCNFILTANSLINFRI